MSEKIRSFTSTRLASVRNDFPGPDLVTRLLVIVDEKGNTITDAPAMPPLTERQEQEAEDRTSVSALVVHEAIRKDGDEELRRPISALAWSGLAAGLSMGFSFVARGVVPNVLRRTRPGGR